MSDGFRTWCIGRHLVNLPSLFEIADSWGVVRGMTPTRLVQPASMIEDVVRERVEALKGEQVSENGLKLLYADHAALGPGRMRIQTKDDLRSLNVEAEDWNEEVYVAAQQALFKLETVLTPDTQDAVRKDMEAVAEGLMPREGQEISQGPGACIEGAHINVPAGNESFGASFAAPPDLRPMGFDISIISRTANDPPYEGSSSIKRGFGTKIDIAGLSGKYLMIEDDQRFYVAIAGVAGGGGKDGTEITVEFYDQRKERGAPYDTAWAKDMWLTVLDSIRAKR
ncbi:MAG: hypothetical protein ACRBCL_13185 [Maritimibacter sp.]